MHNLTRDQLAWIHQRMVNLDDYESIMEELLAEGYDEPEAQEIIDAAEADFVEW